MKLVITGAPGTGKSSIISALKERGYKCDEEISREIIREQLQIDGEALPWKNLMAFSEKVFCLRKTQYLHTNHQVHFFDRGMIDVHAYLKAENFEIPKYMIQEIMQNPYHLKVFLTPIWEEIFVNDSERKENIRQATNIENALINSYEQFGYQIIKLPKVDVEKRVDFILSKI